MMIAAMNAADYETSKACGAYILVRAADGASVTVRITNECPLPCAPGQLDLSEQAFAKLAPVSTGRIAITWSLVSPSSSGTISIRYDGSSPYWCGVQAIGHRNPLARLEVSTGGGWRQLTRTDYNYFLSPDGSGCGKAIRLTDIYGERLTITGIALRPDVVIDGSPVRPPLTPPPTRASPNATLGGTRCRCVRPVARTGYRDRRWPGTRGRGPGGPR